MLFLTITLLALTSNAELLTDRVDSSEEQQAQEPYVMTGLLLGSLHGRMNNGTAEGGEESMCELTSEELVCTAIENDGFKFEEGTGIDFETTTNGKEVMILWGPSEDGSPYPITFVHLDDSVEAFIDTVVNNLRHAEDLSWLDTRMEPMGGILRRAAKDVHVLRKLLSVIPSGSPLLETKGIRGHTALHECLLQVRTGSMTAASAIALVEHGASLSTPIGVGCPDNLMGYTPLIIATLTEKDEMVAFLDVLDKDDKNVQDGLKCKLNRPGTTHHGLTPLEFAVEEFNKPVGNALLDLGADPEVAQKSMNKIKTSLEKVYKKLYDSTPGSPQEPQKPQIQTRIVRESGWTRRDTLWLMLTMLATVLGAMVMNKSESTNAKKAQNLEIV